MVRAPRCRGYFPLQRPPYSRPASSTRATSSTPPAEPAVRPYIINRGPYGDPFDPPADDTSARSSPFPNSHPPTTEQRAQKKESRTRAIELNRGADGARLCEDTPNRCDQTQGTFAAFLPISNSREVRFCFSPNFGPVPMFRRRQALIAATDVLIAAALRQLNELNPANEDILSAVARFFALGFPSSLQLEIGLSKIDLFRNQMEAAELPPRFRPPAGRSSEIRPTPRPFHACSNRGDDSSPDTICLVCAESEI